MLTSYDVYDVMDGVPLKYLPGPITFMSGYNSNANNEPINPFFYYYYYLNNQYYNFTIINISIIQIPRYVLPRSANYFELAPRCAAKNN